VTAPPADTPALPAFVRELSSTLAVHAQYVLHGNVRDRYPVRGVARPVSLLSLRELLWEALAPSGYECLVTFDPVDGLSAFPVGGEPGRQAHDAARRMLASDVDSGRVPSLDRLRGHLAAVSSSREVRAAFVVDYGSRLTVDPSRLERAEHDFFVYCEKLSRDALPVRGSADRPSPLYNPIIWLLEREQDLPAWLTANNERIRAIGLPRPDFGDRQETARLLARPMGVVDITGDPAAAEACQRFAEQSDGLTLQEMIEVTRLAKDRGLQLGDLPDAVRMYKLGVLDNPWRRSYLRQRIAEGERTVADRVVGQPQAVVKTLDILKRAALGLSGAQAGSSSTRPRGVLFFAGPTGVGKTELAKTVASLVFGDESAYLRFDMSEFASEHAGDRLIGAPPGYVGYEVGGELTNAVRQQPFRVVLFDEIEKAHPRILDKFLQILEDGRLTDGRGTTTHFSECVLIFTSNLGMMIDDGSGQRVANVHSDEPYEERERKVRQAISDHFTNDLGRPELLNRFGDNIVVFDFIGRGAAARIFDSALRNILRRVHDEHRITLEMADDVTDRLREWCTSDLSKGGRGIGTALESYLVNPLARALFDRELGRGETVKVIDITRDGSVSSVVLS
jgi:hypothetical protein